MGAFEVARIEKWQVGFIFIFIFIFIFGFSSPFVPGGFAIHVLNLETNKFLRAIDRPKKKKERKGKERPTFESSHSFYNDCKHQQYLTYIIKAFHDFLYIFGKSTGEI